MRNDDRAYYAGRYRDTLRQAAMCADPSAKAIHLELAANYKILAGAAASDGDTVS